MKRMILKAVLPVLMCLSYAAMGQDTLRGPHKGALKADKGYFVEAFGCDEYLEVYLFNDNGEALLNYGTKGTVRFYKDDLHSSASPLVYYGSDGFTAKFPEHDFKYFDVTIEFPGKKLLIRFKNECLPR